MYQVDGASRSPPPPPSKPLVNLEGVHAAPLRISALRADHFLHVLLDHVPRQYHRIPSPEYRAVEGGEPLHVQSYKVEARVWHEGRFG